MKESALYRYLPVNVYSVDQFSREELWGAIPSTFNDPFDSVGSFDKKELKEFIARKNDEFPEAFDPTITREENHEGIIYAAGEEFKKARDNFVVACFTDCITNEMMWAHYGENGTGFALQFDAEDIKKCGKHHIDKFSNNRELTNNSFLKRVEYDDSVSDITEMLKKEIEKVIDRVVAIQQGKQYENKYQYYEWVELLSRKRKCWEHESEQRLVVQNFEYYKTGIKKNHVYVGQCKPTAIFLGYNISEYDEVILKRIAEEKQIPIYKMFVKIGNGKCCLKEELIRVM